MKLPGDNGQDARTGTVQMAAFRSGNHCALHSLVSRVQTELAGFSANDGGARNCVDAHDESALGTALCAGVCETLEQILSAGG